MAVLPGSIYVTQEATSFVIRWSLDTPQEVTLTRDDGGTQTLLGTYPQGTALVEDTYTATPGTELVYIVESTGTPGDTLTGSVFVRDLTAPFTYGTVDYLANVVRYASLASVKARLNIDTTDWDTELTQAIIAGEVAMDLYWGRSLPDTGSNPEIPGIPVQVKQAAENVAVAVFKQLDAPFGVAGSDAFALGEIDIDDLARREIHRSPLLRGYRRGWGVS